MKKNATLFTLYAIVQVCNTGGMARIPADSYDKRYHTAAWSLWAPEASRQPGGRLHQPVSLQRADQSNLYT